MIYDVIFHPDTLHIASKNKRFMDMVVSTALQGVQDAFKVTLDKNNVREMRAKYKGTPHPCIVRKPIPGYKPSEEKPDPLAFPYPDDKKPSPHTKESTKSSSDAKPKSFQVRPQSAKEPTEPNYTVKYRSFIDLQDFRCSRDSTKSPRPKEIVVTIDVPLLKAVSDASLEVREKKAAAAGVQGSGLQTGAAVGLPRAARSGDGETQEEKSEVEEEDEWRERERNEEETEQRGVEEEDLKRQTRVEKDEERGLEKGEEQVRESQEGEVGEREKLGKQKREEENSNKEEEEVGVGEEAKQKEQIRDRESGEEGKLNKQRLENETQVGKPDVQKLLEDEGISESCEGGHDGAGEEKDSGTTSFQCDAPDRCFSAEEGEEEEGNSCVASLETENQPVLITAERLDCTVQEREENLSSCLEQTPKITPANIKEETEGENGSEKVETDATSLHHRSSEDSQSSVAVSSVMPAPDEPIRGDISDNRDSLLLSEGLPAGSVKPVEKERTQGDDLWVQRIKPPPVMLREIDKDGNETVISDHSTSVELVFLNTLIYELD
ncbi:hypothetical protein L3Q82_026534 [Scortum barcoo]|uniref:Uncharacterized protein n=1 Tax=Scortum barcoo TaxID=214431 RepID=A0ACB8WJC1_9TELE|nr:hypothetical protein L3Q82_026534 [Scortum barcoo]